MLEIRRREFIRLLGGASAMWPVAARAQRPTLPVIGFLSSRSATESESAVVAFRKGLAEVGYVEGQNVDIAFRWAQGRYDRLSALAADLTHRQVAVLLATGGNPAVFAAKEATATIPIVFITGSDPVETGLVDSLSRPGHNVTGVSLFTSLLVAKRLELLRELVPTATTIAFLVNPSNSNARPDTRVAQTAAARFGQQLVVLSSRTENDIDAAIAILVQRRASALLVNTDSFFLTRRNQIAAQAARPRGSHDPRFAGVHRSRWSGELWNEPCGRLSPRRHLRRQDPQGREARRPTSPASLQDRVNHQPQDRQGARPNRTALSTRARQ